MTLPTSPFRQDSAPPATEGTLARQVDVSGIVQGVGFRPFIHRLARDHGLYGRVANTASGVTILVEGAADRIAAFIEDLPRRKPPLAHIVAIDCRERPVAGHTDFAIDQSRPGGSRATLIAPDVTVCDDCRRELFDPLDRRFGYPFINCTNCGPRYTIIEDIPYDRPKTSMRRFSMCARCQAEYDDPDDRRYHAQPNACAACGPRVTLYDGRRQPVAADDPIARTAELIRAGRIVAIKGLGGFHLAADAANDQAVALLRARKQREEKPLAVMSADVSTITGYAHLDAADTALLTSIQRPIVLLPKRLPERLAFSVAPRNHYYGVMLPYTPLHYLLMAQGFVAVVMTSGNMSEDPIAIDNEEAFSRLGCIADYFLVHDRPIYLRSDDSIVRRAAGRTRLIRRSRGFVPVPVFLNEELPMVLACGAELKNTVCLTKGRQAFVSQHIGDLENLATEAFFRLTIGHLERVLDINPQAIACDLHPDYLSTQWARSRSDLPVIQVQHHHAHVAACMAEHHLDGPVIGLALDGTGFGPDGTVWGGEALVADPIGYQRAAYLACVSMPGSAAAIKEPWRMGLAYLDHTFGEALWDLDVPLLRNTDRSKAETVVRMAARRINAPLTSSLGRLFDGVAAILGLRQTVAFEGQAAMELEMVADGRAQGSYDFHWTDGPIRQVAVAPLISGVVDDIRQGLPAFIISRKFHDTLIEMWTAVCVAIRDDTSLERVVLSGGCFQNALLLEGLEKALQAQGFDVYSHQLVPTNDAGISLGQALVAGSRIKMS
jgi:hydrogenase maturation protein HypF